jgi:hypothetical protein
VLCQTNLIALVSGERAACAVRMIAIRGMMARIIATIAIMNQIQNEDKNER